MEQYLKLHRVWLWVLPLAVALGAACISRPVAKPVEKELGETSGFFPQSPAKDVDLLFVIDNSGSMLVNQSKLAEKFGELIEALRYYKLGPDGSGKPCTQSDTSGCKIPNIRLGITTTDLGAGQYFSGYGRPQGSDPRITESCDQFGNQGKLVKTSGYCTGVTTNQTTGAPNCSSWNDNWLFPVEGESWISYDGDTGKTNITGARPSDPSDPIGLVKAAFSKQARVGFNGCGFEMPLQSAIKALDPATNPNFLRDKALLAVVFITDEDDCSAADDSLFNPEPGLAGLQSGELGPIASFRCTEFGIQCDNTEHKDLREPGAKKNCAPATASWRKLKDVSDFVTAIKKVKPAQRLVVSVIGGVTDPVEVKNCHMYRGLASGQKQYLDFAYLEYSCKVASGQQGVTEGCNGEEQLIQSPIYTTAAVPAIRMKAFTEAFGANGQFTSICNNDYGPAMRSLGQKIIVVLGGQCIQGPPLTTTGALACDAGVALGGGASCETSCMTDVDCVVQDVADYGNGKREIVGRCPDALFNDSNEKPSCGATCPCWRIRANSACNGERDGSPYALQVLRTGEPDPGVFAQVQCQTAQVGWGTPPFLAMPRCQ